MSAVPHRVGVLLLPGVLPLDAAIPIQTFAAPGYQVFVCGEEPAVDGQGVRFDGLESLSALPSADTVVVPGYQDYATEPSPKVLDVLAVSHREGARMASICTGAFALASAGVLDGRPATTHWRAHDELARLFPRVDVHPSQMYVDDGDVLTSAGVMAGLDLCLHIVRKDLGAAAANDRARALVAAPRRPGSQAAFTPQLRPDPHGDTMTQLCAWLSQHLAERHTIDDLARRVHMSRRTFLRRFAAATGTTPYAWLTFARVDAARELLETSSEPVERIAARTGLGSPAAFRAAFRQAVGTTPTAYRSAFSRATRPE